MPKGVPCSPFRWTDRQTEWLLRAPFQGFRNFSFNLSPCSLRKKKWLLGQKVCTVGLHTHRQTDMKVKIEDTLSRFHLRITQYSFYQDLEWNTSKFVYFSYTISLSFYPSVFCFYIFYIEKKLKSPPLLILASHLPLFPVLFEKTSPST